MPDLGILNGVQTIFDVMKHAIEYLGKNQRNQESLIYELIDSSREGRPFNFDNTHHEDSEIQSTNEGGLNHDPSRPFIRDQSVE